MSQDGQNGESRAYRLVQVLSAAVVSGAIGVGGVTVGLSSPVEVLAERIGNLEATVGERLHRLDEENRDIRARLRALEIELGSD